MDPFDIFPVKVWEEILHRLDNPQDKLNLIKTNSALELLDLFQDKEADWHFSAALGILLGHLYHPGKQQGAQYVNKPWHSHGVLKSAALNCRLVSKSVLGTVDNFVDFYWNEFCWLPPITAPVYFNSSEHVERCLTHAKQLKGNNSPFIGGGLLYIRCGGNSALPSLVKVVELVSHPNIGIGNNLRGVHMMMNFLVDDPEGTYNFVKRLFESIPNVVTLSISFFAVGNELVAVEPSEDKLPELPRLKHLAIYDLVMFREGSYVGGNMDFKQYFEQLTGLQITILLWKQHYNVQFRNLKYFCLSGIPLLDWNQKVLDIIENLNAPALECLTLETRSFNRFTLMQQYLLYRIFNKFAATQVLKAVLGNRPNQSWDVELFQSGLEQSQSIYIISRI